MANHLDCNFLDVSRRHLGIDLAVFALILGATSDHFGTEAVLSIAVGIEHISKMSAYAVGAKTELITLASEDLIRIVGEKWLREYATGVKSENSSSMNLRHLWRAQ